MRGTNEKIVAILLADIHLSLNPPIWRSAEPDWLEAQKRVLLEVSNLQLEHECPVFCVGDIFDKWNCSPELINWAIEHLPEMYAIPGQHDLPLHQYEDIHRSAFQTLVRAKKINELEPEKETIISLHNNLIQDKFDDIRVFGFPFGFPIKSCPYTEGEKFCIAVVHDYIWISGHSYPNAPKEKKMKEYKNDYGKHFEYDIIVYGDNHKGFMTEKGDTIIFNCGTLMRRKSDEIDYRPQVGLLLKSGKVIPHYLDISQDKYLDTMETEEESELDMKSFIEELEKLGNVALDFKEAIKRFLHRGKTSNEAKQIILNAMEKGKNK